MNREDNQQNHHGGGHFNGFFLGVIVGAAIVFLFATKKGKKILKLISEEGLESLTDLIKDGELEEEVMVDEEDVPEEPIIHSNGEAKQDQETVTKVKKKRFFKRAH